MMVCTQSLGDERWLLKALCLLEVLLLLLEDRLVWLLSLLRKRDSWCVRARLPHRAQEPRRQASGRLMLRKHYRSARARHNQGRQRACGCQTNRLVNLPMSSRR